MSKDLLKELREQIKDTEEKLKIVQENNVKMKDELESLWSLADELKKADIKNYAYLVKQFQNDVSDRSLMVTAKKADC